MKKAVLVLGCLGVLSMNSSYAMPANLTEDVYLKSYQAGADFPSTVNMEVANNPGVNINAFCNDHKYCNQYEVVLNKSSKDEIELNRKARVTLKLVSYDPEVPTMKSYDLVKITYLKD
ncbi:MAG: hypothetical protein EOO69_03670 [Moraxellaceae bacterium]|nr:MAG: hypothetical protein EOO69_03670 [Moraxellaceae bacterium]